MEWLKALRDGVVGLDTAPLIYLIEENQTYLPFLRPFFEALDDGEFQVVTSTLTLTEVLVHPMRNGNNILARQYRDILLHAKQISTISVSEAIAEAAAELRAKHGLRTPDAIQLATSIQSGASFFFTNDGRFPSIGSLKILVLNQLTKSVS